MSDKYIIPKGKAVWLFKDDDKKPLCAQPRPYSERMISACEVIYTKEELHLTEHGQSGDTYLIFKLPENDRGFKYILVYAFDVVVK